MIKTEEFDRIIEGFQMGLKDAYAQDTSTFEAKYAYYNDFKAQNGLTTVWSIYDVGIGEFRKPHPWQGANILVYGNHWGKGPTTVKIKGPTWGDLYRAADEAIASSGDEHHCFIEAFGKYATDNSMLELTTGS